MLSKAWIVCITFMLLLLSVSIYAEVPRLISYQGRLTDADGNAVPDNVFSIQFRIYNAATGGDVLWSSDGFRPIAVSNGLFSHMIGSSRPLPDSIANSDSLWLGITVGLDSEIQPRVLISPVNLAFKSLISETSLESDHSVTSVTAYHSLKADSTTNAIYADSAYFSLESSTSQYSDSAQHSVYADSATSISGGSMFRLITENNTEAHTQATSWTLLAELQIPPNEIASYIQIVSKIYGCAVRDNYYPSGSTYGILRILIDDIEQTRCAPAMPGDTEGGEDCRLL